MTRTLAGRLTLSLAAATVLSVGALTVGLLWLLHAHVHAQTDRMLLRLARQDAADALREPDDGIHVHDAPLALPSIQGVVATKYAFVVDSECAMRAWTSNVRSDARPARFCRVGRSAGDHHVDLVQGVADVPLRVASLVAPGPDGSLYTFAVGVAHAEIDDSLWTATRAAIPAALLVVLVILGAARLSVRRPARELRCVAEACAALDGGAPRDLGPVRERLAAVAPSSEETRVLVSTLSELLDRVEQMLAAEERFIAEAAHELRTPLTALRGEIEVALRRVRGADEYREALEWAQDDVDRLARLAEDLLSAAHARRQRLEIEPIPLEGPIAAALERCEEGLRGAGVTVENRLDPGVTALANGAALERVAINLIENVVQHARASVLTLRAEPGRDGEVVLRFEDDGVGVPDSLVAQVFEPFQHAGSSDGHGLGLAIARDLMRRQAGDLRHAPTDTGSVWELALPAGGTDP